MHVLTVTKVTDQLSFQDNAKRMHALLYTRIQKDIKTLMWYRFHPNMLQFLFVCLFVHVQCDPHIR